MGHGCPLRPKQVNGSPRPPPLQRTLSVARGSLDKGILVPKISRMTGHRMSVVPVPVNGPLAVGPCPGSGGPQGLLLQDKGISVSRAKF